MTNSRVVLLHWYFVADEESVAMEEVKALGKVIEEVELSMGAAVEVPVGVAFR